MTTVPGHSSLRDRRAGSWRALAAGCCALALAGCGGQSSEAWALAPSRTYEPVGPGIRWNATAEERHGVSASDFAMTDAHEEQASGGGEAHWHVPAGWTEKPPAPMRELNLQVAGDPRAECYLTTLGGDGGGLEANINRWRSQLSLQPLSASEIDALPRVKWLGGDAVLVDFEGTFTGMSGGPAQPGWRLVGLVLVQPDQARFLKMTGPADVIAREVGAFRAFADSFHDQPHGREEPGRGESTTASPPSASASSAALSWTAPAGWKRGPDKSMREVTYFAGEGDAVECYVTLLGGDGGGVLANINRWCTQMGAPLLTEADVAQLERVPVAGTEVFLVRIDRGAQPGAADARELLLGAVGLLEGRALFVKMTGPRVAVEQEVAALVAFTRSLKAAP